jgi:FAD-dependent urate hydroxylase
MTHALVIGGGIAGPTTAMALQKAGISSVVYEAYPTGADDIGAFLTIMRNGLDALRAVDACDPVIEHSFPANSVTVFSGTGKQLTHTPLGDSDSGVPGPRTLTRAGLYRVLHDELLRRGGRIEHGKRLVAAATTPNGHVRASFHDGSVAEGDLLIGADGIHSVTRTIIDPQAPQPRYTGLNIVYGYARDASLATAPASYHMIFGKHGFFGFTTSPDGHTWWFARIPGEELTKAEISTTPIEQWKQRAITLFSADNTPAADIIAATGESIVAGNAYDVPSTPVWHNRSMVLVGDAAHAASPAAGQGASMALEDSVVLAQCLRDLPDFADAFTTYEQRRRPRVERLVQTSATQGSNATSGPLKRILRDLILPRIAKRRPGSSSWLYDHHINWNDTITLNAGQSHAAGPC